MVVCGARWSCGRVRGAAAVVCGAPRSCVGRGGRVRGAVVVRGAQRSCVGRGGRVWGAVDVCGARWPCAGHGGGVVEHRAFGRGDWGSKPPDAVSKLRQFRSPHFARVFPKRHQKTLCQGKSKIPHSSSHFQLSSWSSQVPDSHYDVSICLSLLGTTNLCIQQHIDHPT